MEHRRELEALFHEAADADATEVQAILERVARKDPVLARQLEALLDQDRRGDSLAPEIGPSVLDALGVANPAVDDSLRVPSNVHQTIEIEGLRILEKLGSGGMGDVWLAEQLEPVRRKVAVKLVHHGMSHQRILARFEAERQALARMSHPCIAQVFGAGATNGGAPYFLMEYVRGVPIHTYCDRKHLSIDERLDLFTKVCEGVQHAHQRGIIHRDLKPSNVLVIEHQGKPIPKIIDFGVAKATAEKLTDETLRTEYGAVIGTPEYMSPEQAAGDPDDIDTRTDIYALGVMLYELLTGSLPFDSMELRKRPLLQIAEVLRETLPPKPSTRIGSLNGTSAKLARHRRTTPASLARKIRGDLDWITMMAMEKDRERRYASAAELSADLERYCNNQPVLAGPPSTMYRMRKFVRRYRLQVAAAVGVLIALLALIGGLSAALWQSGIAKERELRFDRLAVVVRLEEAENRQKALYPAWPEKIEELEAWSRNHGTPLKADLPKVQQTLRELEELAIPQTAAEKQSDRENHPRYREYLAQQKKVTALQRMMDLAEDKVETGPVAVPADAPKDARGLFEKAWPLVDPDRWADLHGQEPLGLALAHHLAALVPAGNRNRCRCLNLLAWALFANGRFEEASKKSKEAWEAAPETEKTEYQSYRDKLEKAIAGAASTLAKARDDLSSMEGDVCRRQTFVFADKADGFLHKTLRRVEHDLLAFLGKKGGLADVDARLSWAKRIEALTLGHPKARFTWEQARQAILKADDKEASKLYAEPPIDLKPQTGLVPIGMNPKTNLWEFYHLRSAWDSAKETAPEDLEIPAHGRDGKLKMAGRGIVFVLIPGGTFRMGAQKDDKNAPNHDPEAEGDENPVHEVTLQPFLLSRYEMTQGQWARLSGGEYPSYAELGRGYRGCPVPVGDAHPVEQVSWEDCDELMGQYGLALPTEAQWEYGCRAKTSTPRFTGREPGSLAGHANILDASATRYYPKWGKGEEFRDGYALPAPVGTYKPNAFGLHDVHGNVNEWCRDWYASYTLVVERGHGLRQAEPWSGGRVIRGTSYRDLARQARSAARYRAAPAFLINNLGLRPAREVR